MSLGTLLWFPVARSRVKALGYTHGLHGVDGQLQHVLALATRPSPPTPSAPVLLDTSAARADVQRLGEELAPYWWWALLPVGILFFGFLDWCAGTRLFTLNGYPATDALQLGTMLAALTVLLTGWLSSSLRQTYDGTARRLRLVLFSGGVYVLLVASIVAMRWGQGDPADPWYVRAGGAGLLIAATIGPAGAIDFLARLAWRLAPKLHRRRFLTRTIKHAHREFGRQSRAHQRLVRRSEQQFLLMAQLEATYDLSFREAAARREASCS